MKTHILEDELTIYTAAELKIELLDLLASTQQLELNLSNVSDCDTAGMQLLILLKREAAKTGKTLSYVMHSKPVREILELARLTGSFGDQIVLAHNEE